MLPPMPMDEEADTPHPRLGFVCRRCLAEPYLASCSPDTGNCSYCGSRDALGMTLGELADHVDAALRRHFRRTAPEPTALEYALSRDSAHGWLRGGEAISDVIETIAQIPPQAAEDVRSLLHERAGDAERARMGEEQAFDRGAHDEECGVDASAWHGHWRRLRDSLTYESRHFNSVAQRVLAQLFAGLLGNDGEAAGAAIVTLGAPGQPDALFRARVLQSDETLRRALERPDRELGPPPLRASTAGRMNARGIAVFYGSVDAATALAEVRPPVGSRVLVGRFRLLRPLRVLNLARLAEQQPKGSVFDPAYGEALARSAFFRTLAQQITAPVMPDDEPFSYLTTQAIADFLAEYPGAHLDGLLYDSPQAGKSEANVVLFHKAARVEDLRWEDGTRASLSISTDDGEEVDYAIGVIRTPSAAEPLQLEVDEHELDSARLDSRRPALALDPTSLTVHHCHPGTVITVPVPVHVHDARRMHDKF